MRKQHKPQHKTEREEKKKNQTIQELKAELKKQAREVKRLEKQLSKIHLPDDIGLDAVIKPVNKPQCSSCNSTNLKSAKISDFTIIVCKDCGFKSVIKQVNMRKCLFLLIILASCHKDKLIDSECGSPCYSGATINAGVGECKYGSLECDSNSQPIGCFGSILPKPETCNDKDDDCDGVVDNGIYETCSNGCSDSIGVAFCVDGIYKDCNAKGPVPEVCNGIDDNCDGMIDNGIPATPCYPGNQKDLQYENTACRWGTSTCSYGVEGCVGYVLPTAEICNGIDDDCDGTIDNGAGCDLEVYLTWNLYNEDLDIHMGIPVPDPLFPDAGYDTSNETYWFDAKYDCFYETCWAGSPWIPQWDDGGYNNPQLNHDDIYDIGPEIISVIQPVNTHPYYVAVHWFDLPGTILSPTGTIVVKCGGYVVYTGTHYFENQQDAWFAGAVYVDTDDGGISCKFIENGLVIPGEP